MPQNNCRSSSLPTQARMCLRTMRHLRVSKHTLRQGSHLEKLTFLRRLTLRNLLALTWLWTLRLLRVGCLIWGLQYKSRRPNITRRHHTTHPGKRRHLGVVVRVLDRLGDRLERHLEARKVAEATPHRPSVVAIGGDHLEERDASVLLQLHHHIRNDICL